MAQAKTEKPASKAKTGAKMGRRTNFALILMPISVVMLSLLRCGQYLSENSGISLSTWTLSNGISTFMSSLSTTNTIIQPILDIDTYTCAQNYTIELLSIDPLVIYINNFMRDEEINHLLNLANGTYQPSTVFAGSSGFQDVLNRTMRSSESTVLPKDDPVSQCLAHRMQSLLGNVQHLEVEPLQVVKYATGGDHYNAHTDWFDAPMFDSFYRGGSETDSASFHPSNRLGSIFAYLEDDCERGETYFPHLASVLETADGNKFALAEGDTGLLVKPRRGNAVFWNNLHANGTGDERTAHLGLPVTVGTKIGLNIWSRYFLDTVMVGGE